MYDERGRETETEGKNNRFLGNVVKHFELKSRNYSNYISSNHKPIKNKAIAIAIETYMFISKVKRTIGES